MSKKKMMTLKELDKIADWLIAYRKKYPPPKYIFLPIGRNSIIGKELYDKNILPADK